MKFLSIMVASCCLLVSVMASAGPIERSEEIYAQGQQSAAKGNWGVALKAFLDAYQSYPRAAYVFSIAEAYEKLGELPRALEAFVLFNQYDPSEAEKSRVEAEIRRLEDLLKATYAKVFISSSPEGAFVFVDELTPNARFRTPVTRWLAPGKHNLVYQMDGFLPKELNFSVGKGETVGFYEGLRPKEQQP